MGNKNINMLDGAILPQIVRYAIPMIFTNILQLMFNVADLAVVGQFCGSTSVAAVGATSSVTQLIILFFWTINWRQYYCCTSVRCKR